MRRAIAILTCAAITSCTGGPRATGPVAPRQATSAARHPLILHVERRVRVGPRGTTGSVLFAAGSVWVSVFGGRPQRSWVARIDPRHMTVIRRIRTEGVPGWVEGGGGMAFGDGSLWVVGQTDRRPIDGTSDAVVNRIDPSVNRARTIRLGGYFGADVAVASSGIWVGYFKNGGAGRTRVAQVEPDTGSVRRTIRLRSAYVRRVLAFDRAVVVQERSGDGSFARTLLQAVDPRSGRIVSTLDRRLVYEVVEIVKWRNELWGETSDGALRLDPRTLKPIGRPVHGACCFLTSWPNGIWLADGIHHSLGLLDPARRSVRWFPRVRAGAISASAGPHAVWLLDYDGTLRRIALDGSG